MEQRKPAHAPERQPADTFARAYGEFGETERRRFPIEIDIPLRASGDPDLKNELILRGHAAVTNQWSLDLGGFRERVAREAFDEVLARNPDTWLLWDHDTRWTLARTANKTLELRMDPRGLVFWGRAAPTSYAHDLRILMERGDIDQASFAFTVARDEWRIVNDGEDDERVERTILEVGDLYDVTITAMGAYPQTDAQVVRQRAFDYAIKEGSLDQEALKRWIRSLPQEGSDAVAPEAGGNGVAPDEQAGSGPTPLDELKRTAQERVDTERAEYDRLLKELTS